MSRWVFLLLLVPSTVFAWGGDGHRIVCAIAWDEMRPSTRSRVEQLLDVKGKEAFADACNWADQYRPQHPETAPWHFVNVPVGSKRVDVGRDCAEPASCIVVQIGRHIAVLNGGAPKDEQAMALKFVTHFVGDIHQPLHASYAEDRGGNRIRGEFMGRKMDMHAVWDSGLIAADGRPWQEIATELRRRVTMKKRRTWAKAAPAAWANESLAAGQRRAMRYSAQSQGFTWGTDYARANMPVARDRLSRAGIRLANTLNVAFTQQR